MACKRIIYEMLLCHMSEAKSRVRLYGVDDPVTIADGEVTIEV
jgi:hypothetical protein